MFYCLSAFPGGFREVTGTVIAKGVLWRTCAVYWVISASLAAAFYVAHLNHSAIVHDLKVDSDENLSHLATVATSPRHCRRAIEVI